MVIKVKNTDIVTMKSVYKTKCTIDYDNIKDYQVTGDAYAILDKNGIIHMYLIKKDKYYKIKDDTILSFKLSYCMYGGTSVDYLKTNGTEKTIVDSVRRQKFTIDPEHDVDSFTVSSCYILYNKKTGYVVCYEPDQKNPKKRYRKLNRYNSKNREICNIIYEDKGYFIIVGKKMPYAVYIDSWGCHEDYESDDDDYGYDSDCEDNCDSEDDCESEDENDCDSESNCDSENDCEDESDSESDSESESEHRDEHHIYMMTMGDYKIPNSGMKLADGNIVRTVFDKESNKLHFFEKCYYPGKGDIIMGELQLDGCLNNIYSDGELLYVHIDNRIDIYCDIYSDEHVYETTFELEKPILHFTVKAYDKSRRILLKTEDEILVYKFTVKPYDEE